jgi:repressor LexA
MPVTLYPKQRQILDFINQFIQNHGYAPTLSELAQAIGVRSLATVHEHLQVLESKGVIRRYRGKDKGIEINPDYLPDEQNGIALPILGFIAAGQPIEPYTDPDATFNISPAMISSKKRAYVLQVKGDSMVEEGILDGDYVVIEEQDNAHNGDIVVALLENGLATLKRYYQEHNRIRLEPANAAMAPIFATNVKIQGKVVGVIRRY